MSRYFLTDLRCIMVFITSLVNVSLWASIVAGSIMAIIIAANVFFMSLWFYGLCVISVACACLSGDSRLFMSAILASLTMS